MMNMETTASAGAGTRGAYAPGAFAGAGSGVRKKDVLVSLSSVRQVILRDMDRVLAKPELPFHEDNKQIDDMYAMTVIMLRVPAGSCIARCGVMALVQVSARRAG